MSKYYDRELPVTVHVTYGGRYSGRTYREFENLKLKMEKLKAKAKNYEDLYNTLNSRAKKLMEYIDTLEEAEIIHTMYANYIRDIIRSGF